MTRLYIVAAAVLSASATMNAAQILVGQYAGNSASGADSGLTANYISGTASCVGAVFQGNACATGSAGSFTEKNYDVQMFANSTPNPTPNFTGGAYAKTGGETAGSTMSDTSGNSFAMMADGSASGTGNSNNFWMAGAGQNSIVIPIGLSGVTEVYTMLNNLWGAAGANDTNVTFTFDTTSSNGVGGTITNVTVDLINSLYSLNNPYAGGAGSGQIRDAVDCKSGTTTSCAGFADGPLAASSTLNGINVTTNNVFTTAYTNAVGMYLNSAGNVVLDDQGFNLSAYSNQYLVSITVQENAGAASSSFTALSGITIDTTATPEPSTVVLLLGGLGAIGFARTRMRKNLQS